MDILFIIYIYLIFGIICIILNKSLPRVYLGLLIFFTFKWIFNYRKCTISRIECMIRNVEKEEGYLYNLLNDIVDVRYDNNIYIIIPICMIIIIYELYYKGRYKELFIF